MQLQYYPEGERSQTRRDGLSQKEEQQIVDQGEKYVHDQMYSLLVEISQIPGLAYRSHLSFNRLNSLIWIWVQMKPKVVQANIRILMVRADIRTVNKLSQKMRVNGAHVTRMVNMKGAAGFGGWNVNNVFRIATALDVRPELMLTVDLKKMVGEYVVNWQI